MNTANLQLEGLCLAIAMINRALVSRNLLSAADIETALQEAEEIAARDRPGSMSSANHDAVVFPIRLLRQANFADANQSPPDFSELTRMVAEEHGSSS